MGIASFERKHRWLETTAAINVTLFGSVLFGSVMPSQAQTSNLPPVTVEAPTPPKTRSTAASNQRTRSSRAAAANRRANLAADRNPAPQAAGRAGGATDRLCRDHQLRRHQDQHAVARNAAVALGRDQEGAGRSATSRRSRTPSTTRPASRRRRSATILASTASPFAAST